MPDFPALLYKGSVKDVHGVEGQDPYIFRFSDRYSVFDWGEMPDAIPGKGEALACLGDLFFRLLEKKEAWSSWEIPSSYAEKFRQTFSQGKIFSSLKEKGLQHHSLGLVGDNKEKLNLGSSSKNLAVKAVQRILPLSKKEAGKIFWDYSAYSTRPQRALVPLELVFRFGAPEGSSFLKRLAEIPGYEKKFGFNGVPKAGETFPYPIVEFFTKLEPTDRFLTKAEAQVVAGLSHAEVEQLEQLTLLVALRIKDYFSAIGLDLWDGKFEFSFLPELNDGIRSFQLIDSIGPDELRLVAKQKVHVSKEILRKVYRPSAWYKAAEEAKKIAQARGEKDWKKICVEELQQKPEKLSASMLSSVAALYPSLVNALAEKNFSLQIFPQAPAMSQVVANLEAL